MARDGEIQNRSLLQAMADYLNIGGVRRSPSQLNLDQVQAVYDIGQNDAADFKYQLCRKTEARNLEGVNTIQQVVFDPDDTNYSLFENPDFDAILTSLSFRMTYDVAGALADDLELMHLVINRHAGYGSIDPIMVLEYRPWTTIDFATLSYPFSVWSSTAVDSLGMGFYVKNPGLFSPFMPAGQRFSIDVFRPSGTWPANAEIQFFACMMTATPQPQTAYVDPS